MFDNSTVDILPDLVGLSSLMGILGVTPACFTYWLLSNYTMWWIYTGNVVDFPHLCCTITILNALYI